MTLDAEDLGLLAVGHEGINPDRVAHEGLHYRRVERRQVQRALDARPSPVYHGIQGAQRLRPVVQSQYPLDVFPVRHDVGADRKVAILHDEREVPIGVAVGRLYVHGPRRHFRGILAGKRVRVSRTLRTDYYGAVETKGRVGDDIAAIPDQGRSLAHGGVGVECEDPGFPRRDGLRGVEADVDPI